MRRVVYREPTPEDWKFVLENEKLLNRYIREIRSKMDPGLLSFDEMKSFGWEGMLQAVQNWDPKRGEFSTLAWFCVKHAIANGVREELAQRGKALKKGRRLDPEEMAEIFSLDEALDEPDEGFQDKADEYADLHRALSKLTPMERKVVFLHYFGSKEHPNGMTHREIAKILRCSLRWVEKVQQTAFEKIRNRLERPKEDEQAA